MPRNGSLIYFYPYLVERRYQLVIKKRESVGLNDSNDSKAFVEYWSYIDIIYENTDDFNRNKKREILIVFDDMIANILHSLQRGTKSHLKKHSPT